MAPTVLVVGSDRTLRDALVAAFSAAGWDARYAADAPAATLVLPALQCQLAVVLGSRDELSAEVARIRRATGAPLLATGPHLLRDDLERAVAAGADEAFSLPPTLEQVVHRGSTLTLVSATTLPGRRLPPRFAGLAIDVRTRRATVRGIPLRLTAVEFALLGALLIRGGGVLTPSQLLTVAWGTPLCSLDELETHAVTLQRKITAAGGPEVIDVLPQGEGFRVHRLLRSA